MKCDKKTYEHLKDILGDITPNCPPHCNDHSNECYQMEADLINFYPSQDELNIQLFEVKRPKGEVLNSNLVVGAFRQLIRDVRFILMLLKDIPAQKLNIKIFAAFPETNIADIFCLDCAKVILSREDFELGCEHLKLKLLMKDPVLSESSSELLITASARGHLN